MVLQLLRSGLARDSILKAVLDDAALEQFSNGFKSHPLGLWHTEDHPNTHQNTHSAKEKECAVRNVCKHQRRDLCNDEVEKPLGHQRCSH